MRETSDAGYILFIAEATVKGRPVLIPPERGVYAMTGIKARQTRALIMRISAKREQMVYDRSQLFAPFEEPTRDKVREGASDALPRCVGIAEERPRALQIGCRGAA